MAKTKFTTARLVRQFVLFPQVDVPSAVGPESVLRVLAEKQRSRTHMSFLDFFMTGEQREIEASETEQADPRAADEESAIEI